MRWFPQDELEQRLARTKSELATRGIDTLVLVDPCNIHYLSGYDAWSFYVPQALVVSLELPQPLWIGRDADAGAARATTFLGDEAIVGYPDGLVQHPSEHPMAFVAEVLRKRGLAKGVVGLELDSYYFTPRAHAELERGLPDATLVDAGLLVNWLRVVKSQRELELMRQAAQIVEGAMRAAEQTIAPGVRHCDVAAAIYHAQIAGVNGFGGSYTSSPPFIPRDGFTTSPHLTWTDEPYGDEDSCTLELVASRGRYHVPLGRTIVLGRPPRRLVELAAATVEGLGAALDAVRPGATAAGVEAAWRRSIEGHGLSKSSRLGYSIGIAYPPTFGERTLSLRPGDETVLEEGMTIHVIPGMWEHELGVVITEPVLVTASGCEPFCDYRRELIVK